MSDPTITDLTSPTRSDLRLGYDAALGRVMGLADFERSSTSPGHSSFHLDRVGLLAERVGNPHLGIPTVHVAGTKGKGSTAAMLAAVLTDSGYRVGLYTSPHLHSAVERIRMGLQPITREEFAGLVERIWPVVEWVASEGGYGAVTTFEMLTAMAFLHFSQVGADFQVIEVGLGGRLDSTNIVDPEVCVITSVSYDHVSTLGNTLEKIAREKAGIIKPGIPVVVAPQPEEALAAIRDVAERRGAPMVLVGEKVVWRNGHVDLSGQSFQVTGIRDTYDLRLPLLGGHQLENAATAVATLETLADRGFAVSKSSTARGLSRVRWPARLEVLSCDRGRVVVDGAHNPYSMRLLVRAVRKYFKFRRVVLIFGALGGHSAAGMIDELAELSPSVLAVRSRHPRSAPSGVISQLVSERGLPVVFQSENVGEATRRALEMATEGDLLLSTGSLSVAAEVIEEIKGIAPELYPSIKRPKNPGARKIM